MFVVFATPSYGKAPCIEYHRSVVRTQAMMLLNSIPNIWMDLPGDPYIAKARNRLASEFLHDYPQATELFFIDDDVGWKEEDIARFIMRDEDVVCGIYPKKTDELSFPVEMLLSDGKIVEQNGLYLGALAATGFMRIKRHVLEKCAEESGTYPETAATGKVIQCWDLFRTGWIPSEPGSKKGRWWGEDYFFSFMCRAFGFEIWIDPKVELTHTGSKTWCASFNETLQSWINKNELAVESREILKAA